MHRRRRSSSSSSSSNDCSQQLAHLFVGGVLVLIACLSHGAEGFCYRKNPPRTQESAEQLQQPANYSIWVCVQSSDLTADLERAPKPNTTQIWFSMSSVAQLKNEAFAKFAERLVKIEIWASKLAVIEDGAFHGLKELKGLILPRNELTILKAAWFKDLEKLLELNLANNRIRSLEPDFLKLLPRLITLDLRGNELTTLPADFVKQLPAKLRQLNLFNNPLNYHQTYEVLEWIKSKRDKSSESSPRNLMHVMSLTAACLGDEALRDKMKSAGAGGNDIIDKCVEDKMIAELTLVSTGGTTGVTTAAPVTTVTPSTSPSSTPKP